MWVRARDVSVGEGESVSEGECMIVDEDEMKVKGNSFNLFAKVDI